MELESINLANHLELEFHRLEFHWEFFFPPWFCSVYSERPNRVLCFFQWNSSFIDSSSTGKNFSLGFALFTQRGPRGLLCFPLFFPVELEFHRLEFYGNFFFFVLLCFPLLIPGIIHWGFLFSFFLVMQTNQKLKRVHAPGEKQR